MIRVKGSATAMQLGLLYESNLRARPWINLEQVVVDLGPDAPGADAIKAAWQAVALRHDALRTSFRREDEGGLLIEVHREPRFEVRDLDWSARPEDRQAADFEDWLDADRRAGADPLGYPNWRISVIRRGSAGTTMVWTIHHALVDGTGMELALGEVLDVLAGRTAGPASPGFADFAARQAEIDKAAARAHFQSRLALRAGAGGLVLPRGDGERAQRRVERLNEAQSRALRAAATRSGATLLNAVQAVWALVLARWSGQSEAVMGLVESGRRLIDGFQGTVGCLIATVPMRVEFAPGQTLGALLAELRRTTQELRPHVHADLGDIRRWIGAPGNAPLFDTILMVARGSLEARLRAAGKLGAGQSIRLLEEGGAAATLAVYDDPEILIELEFDPARLPPARAETALRQVLRLLEALSAASPDTPLGALAMLDPAEEAALARLAEPAAPVRPGAPCLATRFETVARRQPGAPALVDAASGETLDYGTLDALANGMAARLAAGGIGAGDLVALALPRGADHVIALLAVLKVGAAFLPLDPDQAPELLAGLMAGAGARAVIAPPASPLHAAAPLHLAPARAPQDQPPPRPPVRPDSLAYVIHTSGSTGLPKGVMGLAGALGAHADAVIDHYALTPSDRVLHFAGLAFDVALEEILPTLLCGAQLVLRDAAAAGSVAGFLDLVDRHGVSVLNLPASFWHVLVDEMARRRLSLPASVRLMITGSERISPRALAQWQGLAPGLRWINGYGPTEATITATTYDLPPGSAGFDPGHEVPIGRPLGHARAWLCAFDGSLTPLGGVGTLWLGGPAVTGGYLGQPEATAARFVADPRLRGGRLYDTGDLARWREDGQLMFLGRQDRQIKLRGHRIDLHQVESVISALPEVRQAHAALIDDGGAPRLVAWLICEESTPDLTRLRARLGQRLPGYMLPELIAVDRLPVSPNGKIDTRSLPRPQPASVQGAAPAVPGEQDALAESIAACMARVLGLDSVPVEASFHDLGGDSLLALRLVSRIEARTGYQCRVSDLHQHPSAAALAQMLREGTERPRFILPIQPEGSQPVFFGVHVLGRGGELFRPLAEALGPDFPVLGLSIGVPNSLEEIEVPRIARLYFEEVQRHYPTGPIALGAVSMAAYFAFELAQLLRAAGREVRVLALLDATGPDGRPPVRGMAKLRAHLRQLRRKGLAHLAGIRENRAEKRREAAEARDSTATEINGYNLVAANVRAVESYVPRPYAGPLTVFRADRSFWDSPEALASRLGWASVAEGGVDLHDVPGTHLSILDRENVGVLADHLRRLIRQQ